MTKPQFQVTLTILEDTIVTLRLWWDFILYWIKLKDIKPGKTMARLIGEYP
jgi:hypothetical protein